MDIPERKTLFFMVHPILSVRQNITSAGHFLAWSRRSTVHFDITDVPLELVSKSAGLVEG